MKKNLNLILGLIITLIIYTLGFIVSRNIKINNDFIPNSLLTHSTMLLLSVAAIFYFSKFDFFTFPLKKVKFKYYIYGILIAYAAFIIANILATIILNVIGLPMDPSGKGHTGVAGMSSLQFLIFIFIYASICEEFLFRGFTQNFFSPLKNIGIKISKNVFISLPVILSGILFGLGHLILLNTETSGSVIFRIVMMTWFVGTVAGYFQEKHQNILPAIFIHMAANLPGLIMNFII